MVVVVVVVVVVLVVLVEVEVVVVDVALQFPTSNTVSSPLIAPAKPVSHAQMVETIKSRLLFAGQATKTGGMISCSAEATGAVAVGTPVMLLPAPDESIAAVDAATKNSCNPIPSEMSERMADIAAVGAWTVITTSATAVGSRRRDGVVVKVTTTVTMINGLDSLRIYPFFTSVSKANRRLSCCSSDKEPSKVTVKLTVKVEKVPQDC